MALEINNNKKILAVSLLIVCLLLAGVLSYHGSSNYIFSKQGSPATWSWDGKGILFFLANSPGDSRFNRKSKMAIRFPAWQMPLKDRTDPLLIRLYFNTDLYQLEAGFKTVVSRITPVVSPGIAPACLLLDIPPPHWDSCPN